MLSIRALKKKRNGISPITAGFGVLIILIIIGVALFLILSAGGLANIGIGGNGSNATSNVPAYVGFTTTNSTLKSHLNTPFTAYTTPYRLEPNTNYTFPVTIILVNSNGNEIQNATPITVTLNPGGAPPSELGAQHGLGGINAYFNPSSGVPPFNTTLVITTGSNITYAPGEFVTTNITLININSAAYWIYVSNTTWDLEGYPD